VDTTDHYCVVIGQMLDNAFIGNLRVRLTMRNGAIVEGIPTRPVTVAAGAVDELDDTGYARHVSLAGVRVDLAEVCQAAVLHPGSVPAERRAAASS
jgi:hypothetical protein